MEVYVDKKPKSCWECPCFQMNIEQSCGLDNEDKGFYLDEIEGDNCPLKLIKDYCSGAENDMAVNKENIILEDI